MPRHDWIIDVLSDLHDYAIANGLAETAQSVETTLAIVRREAAPSGQAGARRPDRSGQVH
jgi:hypothetical protein